MKLKWGLILFVFVSQLHAQSAIVHTANGTIKGDTNADKTVRIFKSIPFAAPPVGDLRWKAPQAVENWSGVRNCTTFSASPMQNTPRPFLCWTEEFIAQPEPLSEDCLYLNIWTPAEGPDDKLPVFVWIYGGGLSSGSSNCAIYDGEEMAKQGVVYISINYRVGAFGFMAHPELSKEAESGTSGNYGFLDQIASLKWIQKNVAHFGGDPDNVTIAGQSAGSYSVNALVASPLAKGLFHKAIAQSGGLFSNFSNKTLTEAEQQGKAFMEIAGATSIAALREKTAEEIQTLSSSQNVGRFGTTLDGYVLPVDLIEHFSKGLHSDVPLLTGWVTGDGSLFGNRPITVEQYIQEAKDEHGDDAESFLTLFPATSDDEAKASKAKWTLLQFAAFPSHLWAGFNSKSPSYLYQFDHVPPDKPNFPNYGAFHTSEVPYALHTLHKWNRDWQPEDLQLQNTMSAYWVNFAKTGNPNGSGLPEWKSYDKQSGEIMNLKGEVISQIAMLKKEFGFMER